MARKHELPNWREMPADKLVAMLDQRDRYLVAVRWCQEHQAIVRWGDEPNWVTVEAEGMAATGPTFLTAVVELDSKIKANTFTLVEPDAQGVAP